MTRTLSIVACVAGVLLAACGAPAPAGPPMGFIKPLPTSESPSPSLSPSFSPAAKVGQCFTYPSTQLLVIPSSEEFASCALPHTARTVYIGALTDESVTSFALAQPIYIDASRPDGLAALPEDLVASLNGLLDSMARARAECDSVIDETVGLTLPGGVRQASILTGHLTGPTQEQWDAGDRWVRCNVVASIPGADGADARLILLRPDLVNSMSNSATYRVCRAGAPDGPQLPCDEGAEDTWLTISDTIPTPAAPWPGVEQAQAVADAACAAAGDEAGIPTAPLVVAVAPGEDTWGTPSGVISCSVPLAQFPTASP